MDGDALIRTGSIGLDIALGGGWRPGTLNEVWGDPGAAKTILALSTVESMTRAGKHTLWIDLCDGVRHMDNAPRMIVGRPRNAEDAFEMAVAACRWPGIDLVVIDPSQNLVRQRELDGDPEYVPHPQREYRLELNDLKREAEVHGTTVLFVSQPRDKEREPVRGTGISEKVYRRVHLHPDVVHQDHSRLIVASVRDVPGKVNYPEVAAFMVYPGRGIDRSRELVTVAEKMGIVGRYGPWLSWNNVQAQGTKAFDRAVHARGLIYDLDNEVRIMAGIY